MWKRLWRTQKINLFGTNVSEYTRDQINLINLAKEYDEAFRVIAMKEDVHPDKKILEDYITFSIWRKDYYKHKERKNKKPSHGW